MPLTKLLVRAAIALAVGASVFLSLSRVVIAQRFRFTEKEFLSLPTFCQAQVFVRQDSPVDAVATPEHDRWLAIMGPGFGTMHHYCRALIYMQRAAAASSRQVQDFNYRQAIDNFLFVQRSPSVQKGFSMLPEVCLRKGFAHQLIGQEVEAAVEFTEAIRLKPDYSPAYGALVDYFVRFGKLDEAQELLANGLKYAPTSALLRQKEKELAALRNSKTHPSR